MPKKMHDKLYNVTNDWIFKKVFGDKRNTDIVKSFLKSVLDIPESEYREIIIEDSVLKVDNKDDKMGILDVKIRTESGGVIDVEMQVAHQGYMKERVMYYNSKMFTEQLTRGDEYGKIRRVISIIIAAKHILINGGDNFHHKFLLTDKETGMVFTNKLEVDTLELLKVPKEAKGKKSLIKWMEFMKAESKEELDMIATQSTARKEIRKAISLVNDLNLDPKTRKLAEEREKYWRDYASSIHEALTRGREEGREEGKEEGKEEGREEGIQIGEARGVQIGEARGEARGRAEGERNKAIAMAKRAIVKGLSVEDIVDLTGLSIKEIESIKNQIH